MVSSGLVTTYELLLVAHILGALLFFGGALVAGVVFEAAATRERPSEVALLLGLARVGALIVLVGAALVLVAGIWLALETDRLAENWVVWSLVLFLSTLVLGAVGGQRPKRARRMASALAEEGAETSPELRRLLTDPWSRAANYLSSALVVVILVLMVWQPGR